MIRNSNKLMSIIGMAQINSTRLLRGPRSPGSDRTLAQQKTTKQTKVKQTFASFVSFCLPSSIFSQLQAPSSFSRHGARADLVTPAGSQLPSGIGPRAFLVRSPRNRFIGCSNNRHDNVAMNNVTIPSTIKRREGIAIKNRI